MKKTNLICCICLSFFVAIGAFAQKPANTKNKAYIVSNAHFDSQWNWDVQQSINEYIPKTLNQNLFLLGKYPDYIFNFEGGIKYSWMKEYYPDQYKLIKEYIKQGRWHVNGSTWDANDPNIPSTESFTRNILYGQHFYMDEFGVRGTDIFLPDCFGFGWTLPTVAAHSGLIGFSTQKLQWRSKPFYGDSKIPFEIGLWQGVDGSRIMMVADAHNYTTKWKDEDLSNSEYLKKLTDRSPIKTVYHYYGTGDTGGAPTIESVRAVEKGLKGDGPVEIISATSDQLYKDYLPFDKHPELPVFNDELLMDVHATGCYTSQAAMKLYNRKNELLADAAERAAVAADWFGAVDYPKHNLNEAWKRFLWHQFHDDLTGTSLPRAYEFSWNDELISMKDFANILTTSVDGVARGLDTQVKGTPLVIYNPTDREVSDVVEITENRTKIAKVVYNEKGQAVPTQYANGKVLFIATVPANGYVVYDLRNGASKAITNLKATSNSIENSVYKVTLNQNGDVSSILDKRNNKELVESGKAIRLALFTENESFHWPAWEILKKAMDAAPVSITDDVKISVAEQGPVRASLCVERKYNGSTFKQYITLNESGQKDRIDFRTEIDWATTNALLKAEFPLSVSNPKATYDLGVGAVMRGNNTETAYEVYAQQWADLTATDGSYGVSVMNDSKYGWDKPNNNTLRLTLLHTPKTKGNYGYQDKQDFGHHIFTYSLMGHEGSYQAAKTVLKAEVLNQPMRAFATAKHKGHLGKSFSFASVDNDNVSMKAIKQAEKSDEYVVRFYETSGKASQKATVSFAGNIASAKELNGVEDEIGHVSFSGKNLTFEVKPFSMKTFKVKLQAPAQQHTQIVSTPIPLKYNMKTATYNSFRRDANFDGRGHSYAAEILPEEIVFNGVTFKLGEPDAANGMKCLGDTLMLPAGDYNQIAFLAASTNHNNKVDFQIGKTTQSAVVPEYTGFIGQWGHTGHTEGHLSRADVAYVGTHRHAGVGNKDLPYEYTYMFNITLDIPKGAKYVILPHNTRVVLFAATAVKNGNSSTKSAGCLLNVGLEDKTEIAGEQTSSNLLSGSRVRVIGKSGEVNSSESAEMAFDDDFLTKWCDISNNHPKYLEIDLGKVETVKGWRILNAGMESLDFITKEYSLQVKENANDDWRTVDQVMDNTADETDRLLSSPTKARYVRLWITKPDQSEGYVSRIYEFNIY
ncbi:glycoside hydrolase family 38 C-terminal domain-containing protein [Dysgonomonas sp. 25]|uniref:glycoside hydrolase family 38 N-terminal domain-containing protein n=1 Tax=Dysgonomonas sp. 25 TaxID=2302933 RepID=UPI0013D83725|nr:glycoside hydrolase family 38 C-terminal domain-containing protein [Dysgonomonas sp. 25]NDV69442.1 alpha-mannosidase [Dysgonomonas sp. 25]